MILKRKSFELTPLLFLSFLPLLLSLWYWLGANNSNDDILFPILLTSVLFGTIGSLFFELHYFIRFGIAVLVCGLFHRNIYLLCLSHYSPLIASISAQSLNVIFSYFVNARFTCPTKNEGDRKFSTQQRSFFYFLLFVGEVGLHYSISIQILNHFDQFWTWLFTGILIIPYSLIGIRYIFSEKNRIELES